MYLLSVKMIIFSLLWSKYLKLKVRSLMFYWTSIAAFNVIFVSLFEYLSTTVSFLVFWALLRKDLTVSLYMILCLQNTYKWLFTSYKLAIALSLFTNIRIERFSNLLNSTWLQVTILFHILLLFMKKIAFLFLTVLIWVTTCKI